MVTRSVKDHETAPWPFASSPEPRSGRKKNDRAGRGDPLEMHEALGEELSGLYVGETSKKAKAREEDSKEKPIMLATNNMGEEGLDGLDVPVEFLSSRPWVGCCARIRTRRTRL